MSTVKLYYSPFHPKQSDAKIMLFALGVSVFLCLGVIGSSYWYMSFKEKQSFWEGGGCGFGGDGLSFNNDLANTVQAYYLLTSPVIDYVPIEEIPLGMYFEGPNVKFNNQMPADITQVGVVGGNIIEYDTSITDVTVGPEKEIITASGEEVSSSSADTNIEYMEEEYGKPFFSLIIEASPYEGEEAFRANMINKLNLDHYLNQGEQYRFNVNFTVGIDGTFSDIVIQSVQGYLPPYLKRDIIAVFQTMPQWQPASQNGRRVPTTFKLPIKVNVQ
ncbi:hypothetical protein ACKLNQ_16850 [Myroides odoratimimus]|uniref:hypothetical protein n=1 Tax=Myroides odoratimimus TaxID=76832 RepID=UPI0038D4BF6F